MFTHFVISWGRLFHNLGADEEKALGGVFIGQWRDTSLPPLICLHWSLWAENIFSIFEVRTRGFPFYVRQCPLMAQKTLLLSHRILKRTGHKRTWADKHDETFLQMIKDSRIPLCFAISEDRPALCKTSPSESANVRPSLPMSVQVRHCPSKSANVRPSPPIFLKFYLKIQLIIIYINQALHFSHAKLQWHILKY